MRWRRRGQVSCADHEALGAAGGITPHADSPIGAGTGRAAAAPSDALELRLWRAMAVCRRNGFSLDLAARVASMSLDQAREACGRLIEQQLFEVIL
jgi:hypothetical protein